MLVLRNVGFLPTNVPGVEHYRLSGSYHTPHVGCISNLCRALILPFQDDMTALNVVSAACLITHSQSPLWGLLSNPPQFPVQATRLYSVSLLSASWALFTSLCDLSSCESYRTNLWGGTVRSVCGHCNGHDPSSQTRGTPNCVTPFRVSHSARKIIRLVLYLRAIAS
jgi:hypothetical protein